MPNTSDGGRPHKADGGWARLEQRERKMRESRPEIAQGKIEAVPICDQEKREDATCTGTQRTQGNSAFGEASFREKNTETRRRHDCTLLIWNAQARTRGAWRYPRDLQKETKVCIYVVLM